jgi:hypothetical protein
LPALKLRGVEMNVIEPTLFAVINKFPEFRKEALQLFRHNEEFKGICLDYRDCMKAFRHWSRLENEEALKRKIEYETLLTELEAEIMETLGQMRLGAGPLS